MLDADFALERLGVVVPAIAALLGDLLYRVEHGSSILAGCCRRSSRTTLTPVSDGTCLVTAYQNGNGTWAPAPPVQVTIAVAPSTWYAGMRQSFWIAGEERFSIPIIVASGIYVTWREARAAVKRS